MAHAGARALRLTEPAPPPLEVAPGPVAVGVAYFLLFFGAGVWMPYAPLWLAHLGWPSWQVGLAVGLQPLLRGASALGYAYVADRWRVRHALLWVTTLVGAVCCAPLLVVRDFPTVIVLCCVVGLLHGPLIPFVDAVVMDHLAALGGDYGRLRLWGSIGFIAGSWISARVVAWTSPGVVPALIVAPLPGLVWALFRLPRGQRGDGALHHPPWRLLTPTLVTFLACGFLLQASCGAWAVLFALHTRALGFSDAVPGFTYGLAVVVEVAVLFWGRRLLGRIPPARLLIAVLVGTVLRWAATAVARTEAIVVGLQIGHVLAFTVFHLVALALLGRLVPARSSTAGQALYMLVAFGLGGSVGQLAAGALADRIGTSAVFGVEAAVALLGVPLAVRVAGRMRTPERLPG